MSSGPASRIVVAHLLATLSPGGAERVATDLLCGLDRERFDPRAILLYPLADTALERRLLASGVAIQSIGKGRIGFDARVPVRLARVLRRLRPGVVHTHGYPLGYALPALIALRIGAVHTLHTLADRETRPGPSRALHRLAFAAGVAPVCISEAVARSLEATYGTRGVVIRNGVDLARFATPHVPRAVWRGRHGIAPDDLVVTCVARLQIEKDPLLLVDAIARVVAKVPRARLVWVGGGPLRERATEAASRAGIADRVWFLGDREDVPDVLHASDAFALASRYEGLGLALIEAQAAGLPVVATRVGGIPEVVFDGVSGVLVPPGDAGALADALVALLSDPSRRLEMAAQGPVAAAPFALSSMLGSYEALYADVGRPR